MKYQLVRRQIEHKTKTERYYYVRGNEKLTITVSPNRTIELKKER